MTVYVDELRVWPTSITCFKGGSCHMTADSEEELHDFARKLRLRREWFQPKSHPHYDLTPSKRALAVTLGAVFVPARTQALKRIEARRAAGDGDLTSVVAGLSPASKKKLAEIARRLDVPIQTAIELAIEEYFLDAVAKEQG